MAGYHYNADVPKKEEEEVLDSSYTSETSWNAPGAQDGSWRRTATDFQASQDSNPQEPSAPAVRPMKTQMAVVADLRRAGSKSWDGCSSSWETGFSSQLAGSQLPAGSGSSWATGKQETDGAAYARAATMAPRATFSYHDNLPDSAPVASLSKLRLPRGLASPRVLARTLSRLSPAEAASAPPPENIAPAAAFVPQPTSTASRFADASPQARRRTASSPPAGEPSSPKVGKQPSKRLGSVDAQAVADRGDALGSAMEGAKQVADKAEKFSEMARLVAEQEAGRRQDRCFLLRCFP